MKTNDEIMPAQQNALISELSTAIQAGLDAWVRAGEVVVMLLDTHGMSLGSIAAAAGSEVITPHLLGQFERVGRRQVLPRLLVASYPAAAPLQKLAFSEQQRLVEGTIEMVTVKDGETDVLQVRVADLTRNQCAQVFEKDGVRSPGAQRAWLEDQAAKAEVEMVKKKGAAAWSIRNGKLVVRSGCELTRQELAVILAQLG